MSPEIYYPADDSFLLSKFVKKYANKDLKILDMGSGSGIQAQAAIDAGASPENITLVDINPTAIKHLRKDYSKSTIIYSDLFNKVKGKFNLIIFNPPYLPKNKYDSGLDTTGGKRGSEVINKFLEQSKSNLEKNGRILLLTSSLTKGIKWSVASWRKKLLSKKKLFFEELYVWELKP